MEDDFTCLHASFLCPCTYCTFFHLFFPQREMRDCSICSSTIILPTFTTMQSLFRDERAVCISQHICCRVSYTIIYICRAQLAHQQRWTTFHANTYFKYTKLTYVSGLHYSVDSVGRFWGVELTVHPRRRIKHYNTSERYIDEWLPHSLRVLLSWD